MRFFKLPDLGEGLAKADIVEWYVKAGDELKADHPLVSVETAKAIVDIYLALRAGASAALR
jgi:2-oxoisovalerate dehydrogenase E2 component (dihydrolipoyl transacylase)